MKLLLKITALVGMALMPFPLLVFAELADTGGFGVRRAALLFLAGGIAALLGIALDRLANAVKNAAAKQAALILTRIIAVGAGLMALPFGEAANLGGAELAVFAVLLSFCCYTGLKSRQKAFSEIHSLFALGFYTIISVVTEFFRNAYAPSAANAKTALILAFLAEYAIAAVLLNQTNVERQINRRLDIRALIPKNLRVFNVSLILLVASAGALIYLLRSVIKGAVVLAAKSAVGLIAAALSLFPRIGADNRSSSGQPADYAPPPTDLRLIGLFLTVILTVMTAVALFKMRYFIAEAAKSAVRRFIALFKPRNPVFKPTAAYEDFYEDVVFEKQKKRGTRSLKSYIRLYGRQTDPVIKMRLSYKIFLIWLVNNKKDVRASDTVEECFARFGLEAPDYRDAYSGVRYGGDSGEGYVELSDKMVERFIK